MKAVILSTAALAGLLAWPASASVITLGSSYAESCYHSAEARSRGMTAMQECDFALANEMLDQRDRAATFVNRGILHLVANDLIAAERDFDSAIATDPNQAEAWLNKSIATVNRGDSASTLRLVQRAMDLRTSRPALAHYVRAIANEDGGNLQAAYADLLRARELEPNWSVPIQELARYKVRSR